VNAGHAKLGGLPQAFVEQSALVGGVRLREQVADRALRAFTQFARGFAMLVKHDLAVGTALAAVENAGQLEAEGVGPGGVIVVGGDDDGPVGDDGVEIVAREGLVAGA
jgi:hypothetical protein